MATETIEPKKERSTVRVPAMVRPLSLRRLQCIKHHLNPVPKEIDFISDAIDEKVRRHLRTKRLRHLVLPSDCAVKVTV